MNAQRPGIPLHHTFAIGTTVTIFSLFIFKHPFIEGQAQIVGIVPGIPNLYRVRFEGEQRVYERFAHPGEWQQNPEAMLRQLLDHWRLTVTPEIANEFFPNDPPADAKPTPDESATPGSAAAADATPTADSQSDDDPTPEDDA